MVDMCNNGEILDFIMWCYMWVYSDMCSVCLVGLCVMIELGMGIGFV